MDTNLVVLGGRIAATPDHRTFASGSEVCRYLVTVQTDEPHRRLDLIPIARWNPTDEERALAQGDAVWVVGSAQRRFHTSDDGRRSSVEIVASVVMSQ